jgi:sulfate permease, SulP family
VLSLLQHLRRSYRPHTAVVVQDRVDHWRLEEAVPGRMIVPGMIMYWFGSDLFYANAGFFAEQARKLVNDSPTPVHWFVIDCGAIANVDLSAGRALMDLHQVLAKAGVVLALSRLQLSPDGDFERMGLVQLIGANRIFDSRHACIEAYQSEAKS